MPGIFALFLTEFDTVFETMPTANLPLGGSRRSTLRWTRFDQEEATVDEGSRRNKRNSVQYRESQADKLLGLEGRSLSLRAVEEDMSGIRTNRWMKPGLRTPSRAPSATAPSDRFSTNSSTLDGSEEEQHHLHGGHPTRSGRRQLNMPA